MASVVIHMAIAKEVNKTLKRNEKDILLGTIAPDVAKNINMSKKISHFVTEPDEDNIPDLELFLSRYQKFFNDDFVLGYYIHLYADYLWFKYFISEITDKVVITKLDGTQVKLFDNMLSLYIYNDYTNLNHQLIKKYKLDIDGFDNLDKVENIIKEIPMDKLYVIVDKTKEIVANAESEKEFIFNIDHVEKFIHFAKQLILSNLRDLNVIEYY